MKRIVVIGSTNTDMVIKAVRIPAPGETILGGRFMMNPGGKGANQAVAAARLGGNVTFIAKVGNDLFAREAKALLKNEGICTDYILTDTQAPSGVALIMVGENGENCISVASGANGTLTPEEVEDAQEVIEHADLVLLQLETPLDAVCRAAEIAVGKSVPVILNPAPAQAIPEDLYECLEVITPNQTETELLTGIKVSDLKSAETAAKELCSKGALQVVITMGSMGAYAFDGTQGIMVEAVRVQAVDTTAAGDVFNGALAVALTEDLELADAVAFAARAAAVSVTRMGAQASAPYRAELENHRTNAPTH